MTKTVRSLVVNLTRFGDLIQSQPVVSALAARGSCSLVCLENFAQAAGLLADLDRVHPLPGAGLLAKLDQQGTGKGSAGWRQALAHLSGFLREVMDAGPPDLVVNLTPSLSARLLAAQLAGSVGTELRGFAVDSFGFNADTSSWAVFLQMASANRGASPFNVVDLFRRSAGLGGEGRAFHLARPHQAALDRVDELLGKAGGFAGFQLGASEERRRWPVEYFTETAKGLFASHGLVPVLLGSKGEAPLGQEMDGPLSEAGCPHINLMGRTSLHELAGAVSRLSLLVTNDTGTMHLAAGLGVPVLAIFLATAQPFDTGPYLEGAVCFEPDLDCHPCPFGSPCDREHACRKAVPASTVLAQARALLDATVQPTPSPAVPDQDAAGQPNTEQAAPHQAAPDQRARIWRGFQAQDGFLDFASLSGHEDQPRTRWIRIQRHFYRRFLDELEPEPLDGGHGLPPDQARDLARSLDGVVGALQLLAEQAKLLAMAPRDALKRKFLANWQRVGALLTAEPRLEVLGFLWNHQSQSQGGDLASMARTTARYHDLILAMSQALGQASS